MQPHLAASSDCGPGCKLGACVSRGTQVLAEAEAVVASVAQATVYDEQAAAIAEAARAEAEAAAAAAAEAAAFARAEAEAAAAAAAQAAAAAAAEEAARRAEEEAEAREAAAKAAAEAMRQVRSGCHASYYLIIYYLIICCCVALALRRAERPKLLEPCRTSCNGRRTQPALPLVCARPRTLSLDSPRRYVLLAQPSQPMLPAATLSQAQRIALRDLAIEQVEAHKPADAVKGESKLAGGLLLAPCIGCQCSVQGPPGSALPRLTAARLPLPPGRRLTRRQAVRRGCW